ncbi:MAG: hypothetical protein K9G70_03585 [Prolixibacteraceae bacterium]|nr:hypothetical protein [Prolixibacteraceae bacterium]
MFISSCESDKTSKSKEPFSISGIYPHLAFYNQEGECGTGAVVPWAERLWVITYGPHLPYGSSDKLYEISEKLEMTVRSESVGGTPANRMIHNESNQLFIGPYAIDDNRDVRVIPYDIMTGRHTGNARHLTDPENKIYYATMEEGFYEVDVNTLDVNTLYEDANTKQSADKDISTERTLSILPGAHGKGLYSGQGVLVYSNNGEASEKALTDFDIESGVLAEWDGEDWSVVRRNQFVEVTGPGGIYGNANPDSDPIWATGWDHKSLILGVRHQDEWSFYRLPKASHSYDGAHGWNTEWPRIRDVGTPDKPDYLMTMHGMFWRFPENFTPDNNGGLRPRSAYLKVIGDFARWNHRLVFGCDDSAEKEFLNKRSVKGEIEGPGQSNSNLWFADFDLPDNLGPSNASGAVWLSDSVSDGEFSEPFLFAGWEHRSVWLKNEGDVKTDFTFEVDKTGNGKWESAGETFSLKPGESLLVDLSAVEMAEWIRVKSSNAIMATAHFSYQDEDNRSVNPDRIFAGLAKVDDKNLSGGLLYGLGDNRRALGVVAYDSDGVGLEAKGYYELDAGMNLVKKDDKETRSYILENFAIPREVVTIDKSSVLIEDDKGRRWRLPKGDEAFTKLTNAGSVRVCREVATERDLFSCHGTFYELPAENADGFAKIRPVSSHNFRVHDYASYRGMLIMSGVKRDLTVNNKHIISSEDGNLSLWAGTIDDLWKLGKPTGEGGPWKDTKVEAEVPSDPYLIGFYNDKSLEISHSSDHPVKFTIQIDPSGHGPWMNYRTIELAPGEVFNHQFPSHFSARWIRFVSNKDCRATAWLVYQ